MDGAAGPVAWRAGPALPLISFGAGQAEADRQAGDGGDPVQPPPTA
jgi:hypothetical protein